MNRWPDLLATALVGTDRRLSPSTVEDPPGALLDLAAVWSVYRRAGVPPVRGLPTPAPAPADERPVVAEPAVTTLASLLDPDTDQIGLDQTTRAALLTEWLKVATARNLRAAPESLPALLEIGRRHPPLRPLVLAAGGARASWLAQQNPDWTYLTGGPSRPDASTWADGSPAQRVAYLAALRHVDPAAGRELLDQDWSTLDVEERVGLVGALATGLGSADEQFLERVLDDRRREVRLAAAELLATLPGSGYQTRMARRASASLRHGPDGTVVVRPPADVDPAMLRDGISRKPPSRIGERAWWLAQVLARTPLTVWTEGGSEFGTTPDGLLGRQVTDGWAAVVHQGLAEAASTQRDAGWAEALLTTLEPDLATRPGPVPRWVEALFWVLEPAQATRRALAVLREPSPGPRARLLEVLLAGCPPPWPAEVADAVLAGLETHAAHPRLPYQWSSVCRLAALRLPVDRAAAATALAERIRVKHPGQGRVAEIDRLARVLQLRHEMIEEIA
ncbi:MAG TPA: DUF5691 domain-containing protein [Micromonosporaceae bacterium]